MKTSKGLPVAWTKHLPEAERKDFENTVRHSTAVLGRLNEILDEKLASIEREEMSSSSYENPAWAYKQAHLNGERNGLNEIKNLLNFMS